MRLHFAAELILELVYRKCEGVEKIGAHIAAEKARIDFHWSESVSPLLPILSDEAATIIRSDRPITSAFSDMAAQRRFWEIEGFSRVPCGGTHLKSTGEVGPIRLKRDNVGKGKERINILLA
jgi:Ser-tRNA(Ala) deacylase AlaX